jgi:hypothetical protein
MRFSNDEAVATAGTEALAALTSLNRANEISLMREVGGSGLGGPAPPPGSKPGTSGAHLLQRPCVFHRTRLVQRLRRRVACALRAAARPPPAQPAPRVPTPQIVKRLSAGEARALAALDDLLVGLDIRWAFGGGGEGRSMKASASGAAEACLHSAGGAGPSADHLPDPPPRPAACAPGTTPPCCLTCPSRRRWALCAGGPPRRRSPPPACWPPSPRAGAARRRSWWRTAPCRW